MNHQPVVKIKKSLITSIKTRCKFDTRCLTEHTEDMNTRMGRNIQISDEKIAAGLKKAQDIQTR